MKIRRNDQVLVIAGKDRGKVGKVLRALPKENQVMVEKVNMVKRHVRRRPPAIQAGIIEREALLPVSKVMLLCTKCHKPARLGFRLLESGKVRVCRACGEVID